MNLNFAISLPGLLLAIVIHEFSHGYAAYLLGDNTAKESGRLTLNPIKHIDIIGFIFLLIFKFGWAKPVPINPINFKNRKRDTIIVSLAGPFSNFIIALALSLFLSTGSIKSNLIIQIMIIALWYNLMLGIFNLLPFPPLDGSKILASLLPIKYEYMFYKYERYLYIILIILVATNLIDGILRPLIEFILYLLINIILR
ncbi:MAG: site-2 protease family protein [Tissierellia bacterium]|nr:site-2 protease family protein [Tissierellia bacterium]